MANCSSTGVTPARASIRRRIASASSRASRVCSCIERSSSDTGASSYPAVSIATAGYEDAPVSELDRSMQEQTRLALEEADAILLLIDARAGVTPVDEQFAM